MSQARPTPACIHCRAKGLAGLGSYKASTLETLAYPPGISSIDITTRKTCAQAACSVLVGIECLPSTSSAKCSADSRGNIGTGNIGSNNYGTGNKGNSNIGAAGTAAGVGGLMAVLVLRSALGGRRKSGRRR